MKSPIFLMVQGFTRLELQNVKILNQYFFDSPPIKIYSDILLEFSGTETIIINELSFRGNILLKSNLANIFGLLVIYSDKIQNIYLQNIQFQENFFHQFVDDPSQIVAGLISIQILFKVMCQQKIQHVNIIQAVQILIYHINLIQSIYSMTNSSTSFITLNALTINFNNFYVQNHNFQNQTIWQQYYNIELDQIYPYEIINQMIDEIFGIKTIGGVLKVVSQQLTIQNAYFSDILAQSSAAFVITTQGKGIINIYNLQILRSSATLLQANVNDGCITISSLTSLLNLQIQDTYFEQVTNKLSSAILTINPSIKFNKINLMNVTMNNSFSLLNQLMKIQFQLSSVEYNSIIIKDMKIYQNSDQFQQYLKKLNFLSISEIRKMKSENGIINLQSCSLLINNLYVDGILLSPIIIVNNALKLKIINIQIQKAQILFPFNLFTFMFQETYINKIDLQNIVFLQSIQILKSDNEMKNFKQQYLIQSTIESCVLYPAIQPKEYINQTISLLIETLNKASEFQGSFILISGLTNLSIVQLSQIELTNNNCSFCYEGLISIKQLVPAKITINQLISIQVDFSKFLYGIYGECLKQKQKSLHLQFGCLSITTDLVADDSKSQIIIQNSQFINNIGQIGVGLYFSNNPFTIINTLFLRNKGSQGGGAIFVTEKKIYFTLTNIFIIENSAYSGGGIYLQGPNYLTKNNSMQSILLFNKAETLSNNLVEAPDHLKLQINNQEMNSIIIRQQDQDLYQLNLKQYKFIEQGKIVETNYLLLPSNQKILNYKRFNEGKQLYHSYITQFTLILKNSLEEILKDEEKASCQLFIREALENVKDMVQNYTLIQNFSYNVENYNFDLSGIDVTFDPYYIRFWLLKCKCNEFLFMAFLVEKLIESIFNRLQNDKKLLQILFICHSTSSKKTLNYQIKAKTFKCQLGEFYTSNGCQQCEPNYGFYSVEYNVMKCSIFDVNKLENITSNQLKLREEYWRPHYHSNFIELCFKSLKQCIGGWEVGDNLCFQGHIGGLCEECDSYNIRGYGNFVKISNTECGNCSNVYTFLPFFLIFIWSFISIMFTLRSTSNQIILSINIEYTFLYPKV